MTALANNTLLLATLDLAESLGHSRRKIIDHIGLDPTAAEIPGARVPAGAIIDAMEFAASETKRRDFGLLIADRRDHLSLGLLGLVIEQCGSVAEMHEVSKRFMYLHNDTLEFELAHDLMRVRLSSLPKQRPRHYIEAVLAMYVRITWLVLGPRWRPREVLLMHEQMASLSAYEKRFGRSTKFGQKFNGIMFEPGEVERSARRDPKVKLKLESLMQDLAASDASNDFVDEVSRLARMLLPSRGATVGRIARLLGTSSRSLQRKLSTSGTSFSTVLTNTRASMAREYLRLDGLTVVQLAPLLGFSEPSAVSRFLREQVHTNVRALKRGPPSS